jgi:hypothetical protein
MGEYANNDVIIIVIMHNFTPFFLVNNLDEFFIEGPQAIAIIKPRIKIITPRMSISICHKLEVIKLSIKIANPIMPKKIPFFLVRNFILISKNKREGKPLSPL